MLVPRGWYVAPVERKSNRAQGASVRVSNKHPMNDAQNGFVLGQS